MASAFERQLKRLGLFGLSRLAKPPGSAPTESDLASARRILVVRPDERIGNAILIIPLLNAIKHRFPDAHLSLVMSRRYWDLCEFIPSVDEFIPFDKKHYARNPVAFVGFIRRLRRGKFDLVFDASGDHSVSFTHLAITAYSGGKFRIGHDRGEAGKCYEVAVPASSEDNHETERHLKLLRAIAAVDTDPRPMLKNPPDATFADRVWQEFQWDDSAATVIIHPGSRGKKRWPAPYFAEVARLLTEQYGVQVGVVWGPSDAAAAEEMLESAPRRVRRLGVLPFRDFISTIRKADIFVSGDCGPMHLAAASPPRIGVVTVFTREHSIRYGATGPGDLSVLSDPANPRTSLIAFEIMNSLGTRSRVRACYPAPEKFKQSAASE
jgi:heptosyltransferase-3